MSKELTREQLENLLQDSEVNAKTVAFPILGHDEVQRAKIARLEQELSESQDSFQSLHRAYAQSEGRA